MEEREMMELKTAAVVGLAAVDVESAVERS